MIASIVHTVAIIPARYASERLPGKPLAMIAGKPMIQHVYERARRARLVDRVLVATDDERILDAVRAFGGEAVMTAADLPSGTDRIAAVARSLTDATVVVNVQGDEPLLEPSMVDETVRPLLDDETIVVSTPVRRILDPAELANPAVVKVVLDRDGWCLYFSRSPIPFGRGLDPSAWARRHAYFKHIGLYVFRRTFLLCYAELSATPLEQMEKLEQLRILEHGYRIRAAVTEYDTISVDTEADLARVRGLLERTP